MCTGGRRCGKGLECCTLRMGVVILVMVVVIVVIGGALGVILTWVEEV